MSKRRLLLADDSITIQKVVNLTFADEDIEVISVRNGDSAIDKFREDSPDLVLADVNMPGLNGYEICEKIKEINKNIPVILLVGSFEPFDEDRAKWVGADDYLTKPFQSISQLVNKVTDLLNLEKQEVITDADIINPESDLIENEKFSGLNDDSSVDDKLIQTEQIGSVLSDEAVKFESHTNFEDKKIEENEIEIDVEETAEFPMLQYVSALELDEMNLLELPPSDFYEEEIPESQNQTGSSKVFELDYSPDKQVFDDELENENISPYTSTKTFGTAADRDNKFENKEIEGEDVFSEMVQVITQRIIEKLSEKVVREIAWEVVPQMADSIIREMAKEKLKD